MNRTIDLCRMFWRKGDSREWQTLSQKQTKWLCNVAIKEGLAVISNRGCYIGDGHEFMARRFYRSDLVEIKPTDQLVLP